MPYYMRHYSVCTVGIGDFQMTKQDSNTIKGIAILCMIFYHLFHIPEIWNEFSLSGMLFSTNIVIFLAELCHICVPLFCFITGYGLSIVCKNENLKINYNFALARYFRLVSDMMLIFCFVLFINSFFYTEYTAEAVWEGGLIQRIFSAAANIFGVAGVLDIPWFAGPWWYCELAVIWIFVTPLMRTIVEKIGPIAAASLSVFFPFVIGGNVIEDTVWRYFAIWMMGIIFAEFEVFRKIRNYLKEKSGMRLLDFLFLILFIAAISIVLEKKITTITYLSETVIAICVILLTVIYGRYLGILRKVCIFLGQHSKYMWLLHFFVYAVWFRNWIYALKNIWIIFLLTVAITLLLSVILYRIKHCWTAKIWLFNTNRKCIIWAAFFVIVCYLIMVFSSNMVYLTNDDGGIQNLLAGYSTGEPDAAHRFINIIIGCFISFFYKIMPGIQWWYVYSQFLVMIGLFLLHFSFFKISFRKSFPGKYLLLLLGILDFGFIMYNIANISFTVVPGILGTGCVAIIFCLEDVKTIWKRRVIITGVFVLYILLLAHRRDSGLALLCYIMLAFLYYCIEEGQKIKKILVKFGVIALSYLSATAIVIGINNAVQNYIDGEDFVEYYYARSAFMDYPHDTFDENPQMYEAKGWDKDTYLLVSNWCFMDEDVTTENFEYFSDNSIYASQSKIQIVKDVINDASCRPILLLYGISFLVLFVVLRIKYQWKVCLFFIFNNCGTLILLLYQLLQGRMMYRSIVIVLLPAFIINWILIIKSKKTSQNTKRMVKIGIFAMILLCIIPVFEHIFDGEYQRTVSEARKREQYVNDHLLDHEDCFFIRQVGLINSIDPWKIYIEEKPSNMIAFGDSTWYSHDYYEKLEKYGISDLNGEVFKRDDVYFLSLTNVLDFNYYDNGEDIFGAFYRKLKENYGAIGFVQEDQIGENVYVYHFIFQENKERYPYYLDINNGIVYQMH